MQQASLFKRLRAVILPNSGLNTDNDKVVLTYLRTHTLEYFATQEQLSHTLLQSIKRENEHLKQQIAQYQRDNDQLIRQLIEAHQTLGQHTTDTAIFNQIRLENERLKHHRLKLEADQNHLRQDLLNERYLMPIPASDTPNQCSHDARLQQRQLDQRVITNIIIDGEIDQKLSHKLTKFVSTHRPKSFTENNTRTNTNTRTNINLFTQTNK